MKKVLLSLSLLIAVVLGFMNITTVNADATNLFDPTKATVTIDGSYMTYFHYADPTLPNGTYTFELRNQTFGSDDPELANYYIETVLNGSDTIQEWINFDQAEIVGSTLSITTVIEEGTITIGQIDPQSAGPLFASLALNTTNFSIVMNEIDDVEPVFTYSSLQVNAAYDNLPTAASIKAQLAATDDVDGNVTSRIEIYNDSYTALEKIVGGDYYIMYRVSDTAGNYAYLRVDIEIIDEIPPYIIYDGVTYEDGATITLPSFYVDDVIGEKITLDDIIANSEILDGYFTYCDGCEVSGIDFQIVMPSLSGEMDPWNVVGTHEIMLYITDGFYQTGVTATITMVMTVLANNAPVITGPASQTVEITSFNFASILAQYSATDIEDGALTVTIDASTTWNYASPTLGTFNLVLRATDSNGKYTLKTVPVTVRDTTIPVFKINNIAVTSYAITVNMSNTSTLQALIDSIVITDAYYGTITASKVVPSLPSLTIPATTNMTITCTDASGNVGSLVLTVTVVDDVLPVINGPIKVVKGRTATMVTADITALLGAVDNVSGVLPVVVVTDGYSGNMQTIGSYLIQYKATDSAGNIRYHDVRIWVVDNVAPVWVFDDYFINMGVDESMTRTELIALLQASGMLANDLSYTVTFLTDEYTGNELIEGAYNVVMRITYANGSQSDISVQLSVPAAVDDDIIVVTPETPLTGFQKFLSSVKDFGVKVWQGIVTGWNWVKGAAVWTYEHIIYPIYQFVFVKEDPVTTIPPLVTTTITTTTEPVSTLPQTTTYTPPLENL